MHKSSLQLISIVESIQNTGTRCHGCLNGFTFSRIQKGSYSVSTCSAFEVSIRPTQRNLILHNCISQYPVLVVGGVRCSDDDFILPEA